MIKCEGISVDIMKPQIGGRKMNKLTNKILSQHDFQINYKKPDVIE